MILVASLLLAWGRFAPMFYGLLYQLPYFSTIRNPAKFFIFFVWALVVLFAYGIHALSQRYLAAETAGKGKIVARHRDAFDRKWTFACAGIFGASILGWLIFAGHKPEFVEYLKKVGFGDEDLARQIAAFSIGQVGWFIVLFAIALTLLTLVIAGFFPGRARNLARCCSAPFWFLIWAARTCLSSFTGITNKNTKSARSTPLLISCAPNPTNTGLPMGCLGRSKRRRNLICLTSSIASNGRNITFRITTSSRSI